MGRDIVAEVTAIYDAMARSEAASEFLEPELGNLRVVARLTVEFLHYLENKDLVPDGRYEREYACESVFSGVDSFMLFNAAYRRFGESRTTTLPANITSVESLTELFFAKYREFADEAGFETRCRLLLDLFKLQIVFAGLTYE